MTRQHGGSRVHMGCRADTGAGPMHRPLLFLLHQGRWADTDLRVWASALDRYADSIQNRSSLSIRCAAARSHARVKVLGSRRLRACARPHQRKVRPGARLMN